MLTRTLATVTLLLTLTGGADPTPTADRQLDQGRAAHRRAVDVDDVGGCREAPPAPVPVATATCSDEGQP
jgi:hypothetical protein